MLMRFVVAAAIFWLALPQAGAQTTSADLYIRSLSACIEAKLEEFPKLDTMAVIENLVLRDPNVIVPLPPTLAGVRLEYLNEEAVARRLRASRKEYAAIEIKPMRNRGDELIIDCAEYSIRMKKGLPIYGILGGVLIRWRFDSSSHDYVKVAIEPWWPRM